MNSHRNLGVGSQPSSQTRIITLSNSPRSRLWENKTQKIQYNTLNFALNNPHIYSWCSIIFRFRFLSTFTISRQINPHFFRNLPKSLTFDRKIFDLFPWFFHPPKGTTRDHRAGPGGCAGPFFGSTGFGTAAGEAAAWGGSWRSFGDRTPEFISVRIFLSWSCPSWLEI